MNAIASNEIKATGDIRCSALRWDTARLLMDWAASTPDPYPFLIPDAYYVKRPAFVKKKTSISKRPKTLF